ncbi:NUDIX domain-containing protein [Palleronia caenipelagi]|uniref:NUDIX domain-containing protein n=1 Tax=Palleronia caenipelagi TaxID=2489174 RepID=A0A547Q723_9RHOB|nr:NUDIX hydrolase [Palleronia caenipelagi]TRD22169.1 NUDIX domain-containing protein [Palleronia caenipelagi]
MGTESFIGAKVALLWAGQIVTLLRDDRADIPFPGLWDLPGGGREGNETPLETALRETREETGLRVSPNLVRYRREYRSASGPAVFFGADLYAPPMLRKGSEGQALRLMPLGAFVSHPDGIPHFQALVRDWRG